MIGAPRDRFRGLLFDPTVDVRAGEPPSAPDLERRKLLGGRQPVNGAFRNLEIRCDLKDRQDVGIRYRHWRKMVLDDKFGNEWQHRSLTDRRSQWRLT